MIFRPLVIGFGHEAQQGKDTSVAHLIETFGSRVPGTWGKYFPLDIRRYSFADALKVEVFDWIQATAFIQQSPLYPILEDLKIPGGFYTSKAYPRDFKLKWVDSHKTELRPLLQAWGTEFRRTQDPQYWVRQTQKQIEEDNPQVALLSDMRFPNEAEICDYTVRVKRLNFSPVGGTHSSETLMDGFRYDYWLVAEGVEELKEKAGWVFEEIGGKVGLLTASSPSSLST